MSSFYSDEFTGACLIINTNTLVYRCLGVGRCLSDVFLPDSPAEDASLLNRPDYPQFSAHSGAEFAAVRWFIFGQLSFVLALLSVSH